MSLTTSPLSVYFLNQSENTIISSDILCDYAAFECSSISEHKKHVIQNNVQLLYISIPHLT